MGAGLDVFHQEPLAADDPILDAAQRGAARRTTRARRPRSSATGCSARWPTSRTTSRARRPTWWLLRSGSAAAAAPRPCAPRADHDRLRAPPPPPAARAAPPAPSRDARRSPPRHRGARHRLRAVGGHTAGRGDLRHRRRHRGRGDPPHPAQRAGGAGRARGVPGGHPVPAGGRGPLPLAVLSHGSPREPGRRGGRLRFEPQSRWFLARGFVVLVPMRRGYGGSDGEWAEGYGSCEGADYRVAGLESAKDIGAAARFVAGRSDVDRARILLVGHSAGGFGSIALASLRPPGVVGVVNFSGGRGSIFAGQNCAPRRLVEAMEAYGAARRSPACGSTSRMTSSSGRPSPATCMRRSAGAAPPPSW